ncbi:MAG: hypothetical protein DRG78_21570 [Epsilonproteobacteria bacterium]|nr:MAG: hypothetical protein DRG78_21570 [Campylobacterota bacterium]
MKGIFLLFITLSTILNAAVQVTKASEEIPYNSRITTSNVYFDYVNNLKTSCSPINKDILKKNVYVAKIILKRGRIICRKDVVIANQNRIIFNFGSIEIEKDGKLIRETGSYIKIKNTNGKIEKIYKNGYTK